MGQKTDKFVQHDSFEDRSGVYKQSTTANTNLSPVSCKTDGKMKNKGFWRRLADDILGQDVTPEFQKHHMFTTLCHPLFPMLFDLEPNNDAVQNPVAGELDRDLDIQLEYNENPSVFGLGLNFGMYKTDEMFGKAKYGLTNREDLEVSRWAGLFFGRERRCCWPWAKPQMQTDGWIGHANRNLCWSKMPRPILIPYSPLVKAAFLAAGFAGTSDQDDFKMEDPADGLQTPVHSGSDDDIQSADDPGFDLIDDGGDLIPPLPLILLSQEMQEDDEDPNKTFYMEVNGCLYKICRMLGKGGFGYVYEGTCDADDLKVAIKVIEKTESVNDGYIKIPGYPERVPQEIGLHMLATTGEHVPVIIELLDWQDLCGFLVIILEYPSPCENVMSFVNRSGGNLTENIAKAILWQATEASEICLKRRVFHRDLSLENLLINPNTLEVKLIDFGGSELRKSSAYTEYLGLIAGVYPEFTKTGEYHCEPATVYSLGVLLFSMLCRDYPTATDLCQFEEKTWRKDFLTKECCDLIQACLEPNPDERIHLEKILDHAWFKDKDPAEGLQIPVYSGSDDVIQYPDDSGSDVYDDGDVQIPPLPLILLSHKRMEDDEDPNVTTEIESNGRQSEIDRIGDDGGFGAVNEGTCVKDCLKTVLKVAGKTIIRLLPDLLRMI